MNEEMQESDSDLEVRSSAHSSNRRTERVSYSGLFKGHEVKEMLDKSRSQRLETLQVSDDQLSSAPVHRIQGRIVSQQEWKQEQSRLDPRIKRQRQRDQNAEFERNQVIGWKQGLEQSSGRRARAEEALEIARQPVGHGRPDKNFENDLKTKQRWDDPLTRLNMNASLTTSATSKPVSLFQAPANRLNIPPGYRWDGVIRGTDYERRWFERTNEIASKKRGQYRPTLDD